MRYVLAFLCLSLLVWGVLALYYHANNGGPLIVAGLGGCLVWYLIERHPPKMGE